jgi:chromosome segregation ATPase
MTQGAGSGLSSTGAVGDRTSAYLEGQLDVLRVQLASLEAADEHRRGELAAARAEAAEAQATLRESQARLEEHRHLIEDLRQRLAAAQATQTRAEQERAAVIEALGWRAKRRMGQPAPD